MNEKIFADMLKNLSVSLPTYPLSLKAKRLENQIHLKMDLNLITPVFNREVQFRK